MQVQDVVITVARHADDRWLPPCTNQPGRSTGVRSVSNSLCCRCGGMLRISRSRVRHRDSRSRCPGCSGRLQSRLRQVQRCLRCIVGCTNSMKSSGLVRSDRRQLSNRTAILNFIGYLQLMLESLQLNVLICISLSEGVYVGCWKILCNFKSSQVWKKLLSNS